YHFDGWMTDEALTIPYAFSTMPINGITLYAKWTISSYTLIYESNGGSSIDEITQEYMTPINAPTPPTKDGFVFGGWYDDASYTSLFIFTTMPSSDMTIYAKWDPILYTINFINPMDDSEAASPIDLPEGADINLSSPYDLEGYTFDSWYLDEALTIAFNIDNMPDYDFTVYGKWDLMSYTVTFETNSGTIFVDQVVYYKDLVPNPGIPVKEGYLFAGWYYNELLTFPYEFIDMPATDITIYAKWVEKGEFYPIDLLMINQPNESVVVQGVIYFTFLDPLDGYYVYDGTGYIFIDHSNEGLTVGDGIKVTGTFVMNNHITQLENITNLTSDGAFITLPSVTEMSMLYLSETSSLELDTYGKPIMITGSVSWDGSNYFLNDIELGNVILINSMSYASISNPFESIIGQTITIKVIIHDYNDTETYWDVIHDSTAGIDMHS
ncbi:MAG: InlB B-repeat-containing protein, partial [Acholeplasmataceae bacterium]|nr:InlB B-repeat-containing protein [Acholeplasmataceae bacterium]